MNVNHRRKAAVDKDFDDQTPPSIRAPTLDEASLIFIHPCDRVHPHQWKNRLDPLCQTHPCGTICDGIWNATSSSIERNSDTRIAFVEDWIHYNYTLSPRFDQLVLFKI